MDIFKDQSRSFEERAVDIVSKMTLEEKVNEVGHFGAAIPRLEVPYYNYWGEASHGIFGPHKFRHMDVTSYPVCLAMSQSWDTVKIKKVTEAISDECRAYHNLCDDELHFWCPTVNMARDPRNGRSDENFGEDPFLAGKLAANYIQGMQGSDAKYLKTVATPKHYALNSSENNRHRGSSNVDEATLREYYAKVFEYAIRDGGAQSIMTSYNRVNGVPSSCNDTLLTILLREEWGFDGFVVSDCGAVADSYNNPLFNIASAQISGHYYAKSMEEASAMSLIAGTDMTCGSEHKKSLLNAVNQGLISEGIIDRALIRIFTSRFRLGLFDSKEKVSYSSLGKESICSEKMSALSVDMANDTIVLLKNDKKLLPLDKNHIKTLLVVGPNAIYRELGGYSAGSVTSMVDTPINILALDGIKNEVAESPIDVRYEKGWCTGKETASGNALDLLPGVDIQEMMESFFGTNVNPQEVMAAYMAPKKYVPEDPDKCADDDILFERALDAAKEVDCVIVIAGTDASMASEEHDRATLALPYGQDEKIQRLLEANRNTIVVLNTHGAVTGNFFDKAHTVVNAHFAGQAQGTAIANILFGKVNPNAKLTATWYRSELDLPHINDYGVRRHDTLTDQARTYMYFEKDVLFPFGYGLSYSNFSYSNLKLNGTEFNANDTIEISVDVKNESTFDGAEIVEMYISKIIPEGASDNKPFRQLKAFDKVFIKAGETKTVAMRLPVHEVTFWSYLRKKMIVEKGQYRVEIGRSSADIACAAEVAFSGEWKAKLNNVFVLSDQYILEPGDRAVLNISATLEDAVHLCKCDFKPVFESSDQSVVSVDENGIVTALENGTALVTISVTYEGVTKSRSVAYAVK
jgi:Beta-glucosidase-related glycosidases